MRVELAFRSDGDQDPEALGDRIREAVAMIVGLEALEEFRLRSMPLDVKPGGLRSVD